MHVFYRLVFVKSNLDTYYIKIIYQVVRKPKNGWSRTFESILWKIMVVTFLRR